MGNADSKLNFRKAVIRLTTKTQPVETTDDAFWDQFWADTATTVQDVFALVPAAEIRAVREESPSNLATLCYKAVEKLVQGAESGCPSEKERQIVLNCTRLLTRILPYIFEDEDWRGFFWSTVPGAGLQGPRQSHTVRQLRRKWPEDLIQYQSKVWTPTHSKQDEGNDDGARPLAESLLLAVSDLLFCPDFTVQSHKRAGPETEEDMQSIDSCEYIWEAGVGFAQTPPLDYIHDLNRTELLKLLLTCFSDAMYLPPSAENNILNRWVTFFSSTDNRHALPLFTSLLNVVCAYDPVGYGIPYNYLMFSDYREVLVEHAVQILIVTLEHEAGAAAATAQHNLDHLDSLSAYAMEDKELVGPDNLFVNYLSRIHREEDFIFILKGLARLMTNPLIQTYLPNSTKKIQFHQELLVLFWKLCDFNKKFLFFVLKSSDVLDVLVPILFYLNDARADQSCMGLIHIGVFILLLLSGERNFGVRLNKTYSVRVPMDIPVFTGTHADLLIMIFHKIITGGHQHLKPLFDCLLTIIVNVSPYLKSLSMVAANKLLHLLEAFSTNWFLFSASQNHHLVFFLLEVFNNIIQYQFDGNCNLVYTLIRKRHIFHQLANLTSDPVTIHKALEMKKTTLARISRTNSQETISMDGSRPAVPAKPGTLKASLVAIPAIDKLTEKAQVSEDGTMVCLQHNTHSPQITADQNTHTLQPQTAGDQHKRSLQSADTNTSGIAGASDTESNSGRDNEESFHPESGPARRCLSRVAESATDWNPTPDWVLSWKSKLPLQTIMRLLQVLVPQVEKICIDKGLTDESEILKFLQHGTLVGLLPVPHPILIRKYQANAATAMWFRTYMWGVIYLRNVDPPIWYDTDVRLFEIQRI
ncbi:protein HID1 isoform X2 [Salmo salar]|uniref:Protein HID1 isoform X2 n=1 Tax=Salmo salar TaxID=8030 RepID=A0A1S3SU75_SALSA|nr:protein HID1 isoform X2 [Salmo salar]|eukprot:XP_014067891.1 PREDICTED: protein HID1-like isoform X1 [Salmo salar]